AASAFPGAKEDAAALTAATIPGARLFHEGQFEGRRVRPAVFLRRRPDEHPDEARHSFYEALLHAIDDPLFHNGEWTLCRCTGWDDNSNFQNLVAWCWEHGEDRAIVVVNLSAAPAQGRVHLPWEDLQQATWQLHDRLADMFYLRDGLELNQKGLY